jgi:hypothetical protein
METVEQEEKEEEPGEAERQERIKYMPILDQCFNLMDFEAVARRVMKPQAWAYYSSGADDEIVSCHRYYVAFDRLTRAADHAREPRSISQNLVPTAGASECIQNRLLDNHARNQSRHSLLRYSHSTWQARPSRRRVCSHSGGL